ncbi:hypothetical protein GCM10022263_01170 [Nocardioides daeguensis]|uniref:DUF4232 domain-containing protein n=1 Tax=Nocardioides daeguensis TaxID=908359 RepID=A0ABP6USL3_9ACTN
MYWRRRLFVLGIAFALVFVIARLLAAGSDGSSDQEPAAEQAGGRVATDATEKSGASDPAGTDPDGAQAGAGTTGPATVPTTPTLAVPDGECAASDVLVTPSVAQDAVAGHDVPLTLSLQTRESEACTWQVGSQSLVVKIAQGGKDVWTSRQCPQAVAAQAVVVRRAVPATVQVVWGEARESTDGCTRRAGWAAPGDYTVAAAALGGEPGEMDFVLGAPAPETILVTPKATSTKKAKKPKKPVN